MSVFIAEPETFEDIIRGDGAGWLALHDVSDRLLGKYVGRIFNVALVPEIRDRINWFNQQAKEQNVPLRLRIAEVRKNDVSLAIYIDPTARPMFAHGEPGDEI